LTSYSNRLRRRLSKIAWSCAPALMRSRTRRLTAARLKRVKAQVIDNPVLLAAEAERLQYRPLISVLMPVYNTPSQYLRLAVDSC